MVALLEVDGVSTGYGRIQVVHDVSLIAPRGTVIALLGPSGAGKTTLLRAISGLLPIADGEVRLAGERVDELEPSEIARRGLIHVPERGAVFGTLTVEENLKLGYAAGVETDAFEQQRDEVLDIFPDLRKLLGRRAGSLSGGEQQMVALARAFLAGPEVLLLDEISMGLAPKVVEALYGPVEQMRDRGVTILLVEQRLDQALRLADACYVLVSGRVKLVAEPAELRQGTQALAGYFGG